MGFKARPQKVSIFLGKGGRALYHRCCFALVISSCYTRSLTNNLSEHWPATMKWILILPSFFLSWQILPWLWVYATRNNSDLLILDWDPLFSMLGSLLQGLCMCTLLLCGVAAGDSAEQIHIAYAAAGSNGKEIINIHDFGLMPFNKLWKDFDIVVFQIIQTAWQYPGPPLDLGIPGLVSCLI